MFFFSLCLFLPWLTTLLSVDHFTISGPPMKRRLYTNWCCLGCIIFSCLGHQYSCIVTILTLRWSKGDFTQCFIVVLWLFVSLRGRRQFWGKKTRGRDWEAHACSPRATYQKNITWPFYNFRSLKGDFEKLWLPNKWDALCVDRTSYIEELIFIDSHFTMTI